MTVSCCVGESTCRQHDGQQSFLSCFLVRRAKEACCSSIDVYISRLHCDWFTVSDIYEILLLIGRAAVSWGCSMDERNGTDRESR